jgi:hypothetical protein
MAKVSRRAVIAGAAVALTVKAQSVFSDTERKILKGFIDRLVPADENGPGAVECGAANYIEKSLADYLAAEKASFVEGLNAVDAFARSKHGAPFTELAATKKDEVLTALQNNPPTRAFFNRVRQLTLEGMFSDPFYGGNRDYRGWDLIRYPGPRLAVSAKEQILRDPIKPLRTSSYGTGHGH